MRNLDESEVDVNVFGPSCDPVSTRAGVDTGRDHGRRDYRPILQQLTMFYVVIYLALVLAFLAGFFTCAILVANVDWRKK